MNELEVLNNLKESLIFEASWLYESSDVSADEKENMLESIKTVWNRSIQRAGFTKYFNELCVNLDDFKRRRKI